MILDKHNSLKRCTLLLRLRKKGLLITVKYLNISKQLIGQYIVITSLVNYQYHLF